MINSIRALFRRVTANEVIANQVYEAEIKALQYEAVAERSKALAAMYRERIDRLNGLKVETAKSS